MCSEPDLHLLETLAVLDGRPVNLSRHLARMAASAKCFGFPFDPVRVEQQVAHQRGTALVRIRLLPDGSSIVEPREFVPMPEPVALMIDTVPIDPESPYVHHKTTIRNHLTAARARHPGADDVVLINPAGQVTETTVANLVVRIGARWVTPPCEDGCLPGIGRQMLLEQGRVVERSVSIAELRDAEEVALVSSARGWRRARIING